MGELYEDRYFMAFPEPVVVKMGVIVTEKIIVMEDNIEVGEN